MDTRTWSDAPPAVRWAVRVQAALAVFLASQAILVAAHMRLGHLAAAYTLAWPIALAILAWGLASGRRWARFATMGAATLLVILPTTLHPTMQGTLVVVALLAAAILLVGSMLSQQAKAWTGPPRVD